EFLLYCIRFAKAATVLGYSKTNQTIKMLRTFGTEHFLYANLKAMMDERILIFQCKVFLVPSFSKEGTPARQGRRAAALQKPRRST
ncbi:MAG: hypothetical protein IKJ74_04095, partial [Clostridia bacterium]|nr:hypothetical protein [Clostridia bacterium]